MDSIEEEQQQAEGQMEEVVTVATMKCRDVLTGVVEMPHFMELPSEVGDETETDEFELGGLTFRFSVCPGGVREECAGSVSVFLELVDPIPVPPAPALHVEWEVIAKPSDDVSVVLGASSFSYDFRGGRIGSGMDPEEEEDLDNDNSFGNPALFRRDQVPSDGVVFTIHLTSLPSDRGVLPPLPLQTLSRDLLALLPPPFLCLSTSSSSSSLSSSSCCCNSTSSGSSPLRPDIRAVVECGKPSESSNSEGAVGGGCVEVVVFKAHSLILAARSPVFHAMLSGPWTEQHSSTADKQQQQQPQQQGASEAHQIEVKEVNPQVFWAFLKFLYGDTTPDPTTPITVTTTTTSSSTTTSTASAVPSLEDTSSSPSPSSTMATVERVRAMTRSMESKVCWWVELLKVADRYNVEELVRRCEGKLMGMLTMDTAVLLLEHVVQCSQQVVPNLHRLVFQFALDNLTQLRRLGAFSKLPSSVALALLTYK